MYGIVYGCCSDVNKTTENSRRNWIPCIPLSCEGFSDISSLKGIFLFWPKEHSLACWPRATETRSKIISVYKNYITWCMFHFQNMDPTPLPPWVSVGRHRMTFTNKWHLQSQFHLSIRWPCSYLSIYTYSYTLVRCPS